MERDVLIPSRVWCLGSSMSPRRVQAHSGLKLQRSAPENRIKSIKDSKKSVKRNMFTYNHNVGIRANKWDNSD